MFVFFCMFIFLAMSQEKTRYDYVCYEPGCDYANAGSFKDLVTHISSVHGVSVTPHHCPIEGCGYCSKVSVARHYRTVHMKRNTILCHQPGCNYITCRSDQFKRHYRTIHENTLYACDYPGCSFITRYQRNLPKHRLHQHPTSLNAFLQSLDVSELYTGSGLQSVQHPSDSKSTAVNFFSGLSSEQLQSRFKVHSKHGSSSLQTRESGAD